MRHGRPDGVLRVLAGGEGAEVVAALQQEREGADAVLALEVERLAVHGHRSDVIALRRVRIIGVGDVVRQAELQVRAGGHVAVGVGLPLLFEGFLELGSGECGGPQVVEERQHGVGLGIGDGAVGGDRALLVVAGLAEFGAQARRGSPRRFRRRRGPRTTVSRAASRRRGYPSWIRRHGRRARRP